ncbi:MAG TPA: MipA/OmpV family protein [Ramlibacter sp.]|jgi:outer membrane scaffolding protein for murein synthesis (MipA/OmpV family)|uniref:MipA/OmpV family protein n=1 Tax=Ramlibacter sp. TaxID=1917967 RepID=UPI002D2D3EB2|nr:MipA/OmpV family protein [Ramlibacter sp.]HZY19973.1 MipA/OmpV family protein [Ramlibacter sp.]
MRLPFRPSSLARLPRLPRLPLLSALLALALPAVHASAAELPLWEIGTGPSVLNLPDYRGSDQRTTYLLPVPYLVYRGKLLRADRNGLRAMLFDSDRVDLTFSINGSLPVSSRRNQARQGMEDLRPTVEAGANLGVDLWRSPQRDMQVGLRIPLRMAFTVESSPRSLGWVLSPQLNLDMRAGGALAGWNFGASAGPLFQERRFNSYYYSVAPSQATATRPAYAAPGGYAGSQVTLSTSRRHRNGWFGGFARFDSLAGARFEDSPLVRQRSALSVGVAYVWVLGRSSTLVDSPE